MWLPLNSHLYSIICDSDDGGSRGGTISNGSRPGQEKTLEFWTRVHSFHKCCLTLWVPLALWFAQNSSICNSLCVVSKIKIRLNVPILLYSLLLFHFGVDCKCESNALCVILDVVNVINIVSIRYEASGIRTHAYKCPADEKYLFPQIEDISRI